MTQILLSSIIGILFLVVFSLFFVWLDERSKKKYKRKLKSKYQHFDKYYAELEKESEKSLERKRRERMEVLGYNNEISSKKPSEVNVTAFSDNPVI